MKGILVALVLAVLFTSVVSAKGAGTPPYCYVTPNPVPQYSQYEIVGGGFRSTYPLTIYLTSPLGESYVYALFTDVNGYINPDSTISPWYGEKFSDEIGTTNLKIYYGFGNTQKLQATCSFTVQ